MPCPTPAPCLVVFVIFRVVVGLPAHLRGPGDDRRTWGSGSQVHPARPARQRVALVEPADSIVLVVHVVGDVLQVLEVGAGRRGAGGGSSAQVGHSAPPPRPAPRGPCTLTG